MNPAERGICTRQISASHRKRDAQSLVAAFDSWLEKYVEALGQPITVRHHRVAVRKSSDVLTTGKRRNARDRKRRQRGASGVGSKPNELLQRLLRKAAFRPRCFKPSNSLAYDSTRLQ